MSLIKLIGNDPGCKIPGIIRTFDLEFSFFNQET